MDQRHVSVHFDSVTYSPVRGHWENCYSESSAMNVLVWYNVENSAEMIQTQASEMAKSEEENGRVIIRKLRASQTMRYLSLIQVDFGVKAVTTSFKNVTSRQ